VKNGKDSKKLADLNAKLKHAQDMLKKITGCTIKR